jgi:hypothetical protein
VESRARYLGIEVDDAPTFAEQIDLRATDPYRSPGADCAGDLFEMCHLRTTHPIASGYARASRIMLNCVSVARLMLRNPPAPMTSRSRWPPPQGDYAFAALPPFTVELMTQRS